LPLGGKIREELLLNYSSVRKELRKRYEICESDFLLISGGKLGPEKRVLELVEAVSRIESTRVKLILFGSICGEYGSEVERQLKNTDRVIFVGWLSPPEIHEYFLASDIACFPGTQSVLWQQAICCGLPLICKTWPGSEYLDRGGNVKFLVSDDSEGILRTVEEVVADFGLYTGMRRIAEGEAKSFFSYSRIAASVLDDVGLSFSV
jgi:glycosyltransferase involved in cell wall biosynthesis